MTVEKLPHWLNAHLGAHSDGCHYERCTGCIDEAAQIFAISRYAREVRRAALEEAARTVETASPSHNRNDLAERIRALLAKETAHE